MNLQQTLAKMGSKYQLKVEVPTPESTHVVNNSSQEMIQTHQTSLKTMMTTDPPQPTNIRFTRLTNSKYRHQQSQKRTTKHIEGKCQQQYHNVSGHQFETTEVQQKCKILNQPREQVRDHQIRTGETQRILPLITKNQSFLICARIQNYQTR